MSQDEQSEDRNLTKATPEYSTISNNTVPESNNSSMYAEPDPNVIVTPTGVISLEKQVNQNGNSPSSAGAIQEYSTIPNHTVSNDPTKSDSSLLYAEPDPNVVVTPAGVGEQQQNDTSNLAEQSDDQAYAKPRASPAIKSSTNAHHAYEDIDSAATNQGKGNTYEDHLPDLPAGDTLVTESSNEQVDDDSKEGMYSKPKKQVPSTDYATPQPAYTKADKVSSNKAKQSGLEGDMASDYSHLQATQTSNDESYQKLDRGIDVKMKDGR